MASFMNSLFSDVIAIVVFLGFIILVYGGLTKQGFEEAAASLKDKIFGVKEKK